MKVLIFGVSGFVGAYLSKEFLNHNYTVVGTDRQENCRIPNEVKFIKSDILDSPCVENLIAKEAPDIIVNLVAVSSVGASWKMPRETMSVNVIGALNIMEAVRKTGKSSKVLFIGSSEEYEPSLCSMSEQTPLDANNPYGISKITQERFAALYRDRYGMMIYCVRPFNHTGIGQSDAFVLPSFCKQVADIEKSAKPGKLMVGNLAAERDFSDVRDVARAYRMIIESKDCSKTYNVGSGKSYSLQYLLDYIVSLSSQIITIETDPDRFRPADTPRICCDNRYIKQELGWEPEYDIFDTLKEMYMWYLEN